MKKLFLIAALTSVVNMQMSITASASDRYLGEIIITAKNFCPRGSVLADGRTLGVAQNMRLYSLIGSNFGGDGRVNFMLPDLRGRTIVGDGSGSDLSPRETADTGGSESTVLTEAQMPKHNHEVILTTASNAANSKKPHLSGFGSASSNQYVDSTDTLSGLYMHKSTVHVENSGGGTGVNNMQPYTTLNFCIVTSGLFPSRAKP